MRAAASWLVALASLLLPVAVAVSCTADTASRGLPSCTLALPCIGCIDRPGIKVRAVVHGQQSDLFWLRVRRAMQTAADQMKIDFRMDLQVRTSNVEMAANVRRVVADEQPDALIVTFPGAEVITAAQEASSSTIVFALNSGLNDFRSANAIAYFGQDERLAGEQALGQFQAAAAARGVTLRACVAMNHGPGAGWSVPRVAGFKSKCDEAGLTWLGADYGVQVDEANVDSTKAVAETTISDYLSSGASTDALAMLGLGFGTSAGIRAGWVQQGRPDRVLFGHFDVDTEGIAAGEVVFTIDQNEWLQGYYPVVLATLYVTTGNLMAPEIYPTGPAFVTEVPTAAQSLALMEAFPVCDCPWFGGYEDMVPCTPSVDGAIAECPRATACESPCVDGRTFKIVGVTHAHEADTFWFTVKAGAEQAANDLRLVNFQMDLFAPPGSDRADAFTEDLFASTLREKADDPTVDGIFASIHGAYIEDDITYAAARKHFVTINSGSDVSASLNPAGGKLVGHVGMDERLAGELAGTRLSDAGVTHLAVLNHDNGNAALVQRQEGARASMQAAGKTVTLLDMVADGIAADDDNAIASYVATKLGSDATIDSLLTLGSSLVPAALTAMANAGKDASAFKAGSFDTSDQITTAISEGNYFIFGVDQLAYMQGYMAVSYLYVKMLSNQQFAFSTVPSGPFFVTSADPVKGQCIGQTWTPETVGAGRMPLADESLTVGFPICEVPGACSDPATFFNTTTLACQRCPAGTFKNATLAECQPCPAGQSTNGENGQQECNLCMPGTHAPSAGTESCVRCPVATYASGRGTVNCTACPEGLTTDYTGAVSPSECACDEGSYRTAGVARGCEACPKGMTCAFGSDMAHFPDEAAGPFPMVDEGYMTLDGAPLTVYKCVRTDHCPGGLPASCAVYRDTSKVACATCDDDAYQSGGQCEPCEGGDVVPFVFLILIGISIVAGITVAVNRDVLLQTNATLTCLIACALLFTGIQTLGVFKALAVDWFEPVNSILQVLSLLSFDLKVVRIGCIVGDSAVRGFTLRQLVAPLTIPCMGITLLAKKYVWQKKTDVGVELTNTVGTVFNVFFISIVISGTSPMVCYSHPSPFSSVMSAPSILCWEGGEHTSMVTVGLIALCLVPLPFFALAAWGTYLYPSFVNDPSDSGKRQLQRFRFLFIRFRPETYYYGVLFLFRSLLICMVPLLFEDVVFEICIMAAILGFFIVVQMQLRPWRGGDKTLDVNCFDGAANMMIIMLLLCVSMASDISTNAESIKVLGTIAFGAFIVVGFCLLAKALYDYLTPGGVYDYFLCHHKVDAQAQVRFIKMQLQAKGKHVFVDSDDLKELDELLDTVKTKVRLLAVYLTRDTLTRPWCAGEVVSATTFNVKVTLVKCPSFSPPTAKQLDDIGSYLDLSGTSLTRVNISPEDVKAAYVKLMGPGIPTLHLQPDAQGSQRFTAVVQCLLKQTTEVEKAHALPPIPRKVGMVVISTHPENDEAIAAGCILRSLVDEDVFRSHPEALCFLTDYAEDLGAIREISQSACCGIILLSPGTLNNVQQLTLMTELVRNAIPTVPVCIPGFNFPGDEYYRKVLPTFFPGTEAAEAKAQMERFFGTIAVALSTHASEQVLKAQSQDVLSRIPKGNKRLPTDHSSKSFHSKESNSAISVPKQGEKDKGIDGRDDENKVVFTVERSI